jgi:hypothetical protein
MLKIPDRTVIALSGYAGAGKDTTSNYLCDKHNGGAYSFAKVLKDTAGFIFGLDSERLINDYDYKVQHRKLLIDVGKKMREVDVFCWVDAVIRQIRASEKMFDGISTIPDLRFYSEIYRLLKEFGQDAWIIRVTCSPEERERRIGSEAWEKYCKSAALDYSETELGTLEINGLAYPEEHVKNIQVITTFIPGDRDINNVPETVCHALQNRRTPTNEDLVSAIQSAEILTNISKERQEFAEFQRLNQRYG